MFQDGLNKLPPNKQSNLQGEKNLKYQNKQSGDCLIYKNVYKLKMGLIDKKK